MSAEFGSAKSAMWWCGVLDSIMAGSSLLLLSLQTNTSKHSRELWLLVTVKILKIVVKSLSVKLRVTAETLLIPLKCGYKQTRMVH